MIVSTFIDLDEHIITSLREILANKIDNKTHIGIKKINDLTFTKQVILNVGNGQDDNRGFFRTYTVSGLIFAPSRSEAVKLNELAIGAFRVLPLMGSTVLKNVQINQTGATIASNDGTNDGYIRGFTLTFWAKATEHINFTK